MMLALLSALAFAACPVDDWPSEEWTIRPPPAGRTAQWEALESYLFPPELQREHPDRLGVRTDGVVIVLDGAVIYERYGGDYSRDAKHLAWSMSKSFTNALTGIAVGEGKLTLGRSVCDHLDAPESACKLTVRDLLTFASGLDWRETYEGESPTTSAVLAMLYGEGRADMAAFTLAHTFRDEPGTSYQYSSGDTNVISAILREVLEEEHGERYPWKLLFEPLGMRATWERDAAGTYVGSSYIYATPRDFARFGLMLARDGCIGRQRLLPEGWIAQSTQVSEGSRTKGVERDDGDVQGSQFWLNRPIPEVGQALPWEGVPEGSFAARGHWAQSITVVEGRDLVIVRTADDRDGTWDHAHFLRLVLAAVGEPPAEVEPAVSEPEEQP